MKRILISLAAATLALTSAFSLAGCGSSGSSSSQKDTSSSSAASAASKTSDDSSADSSVSANEVKFTYNGATVELNTEIETMLAALGDPISVSSQMSCHGEGEDKTYTYDGFVVNSYPRDGKDYVMEIVVSKDGIPTSKGIQVGSSASDVVAAYGKGYKEVGVYYAYDAGNKMSLQFYIENDAVKEIDYFYNV